MKKLLLITLTVFGLIMLVGCSGDANGSVAPEATVAKQVTKKTASKLPSTYEAILKVVKAEQKKAKKVGFEWNTIGGKKGLLVKAKKLQKKGDEKEAIRLLEIAKAHAILGQKQAVDQANAGPNF